MTFKVARGHVACPVGERKRSHLLLLHVILVRCHATIPQSYLFQSGNHCKSIHRDVAVSSSRRGGSRTLMLLMPQRGFDSFESYFHDLSVMSESRPGNLKGQPESMRGFHQQSCGVMCS
ncbi:hypothetical protein EDD22DRAFT_883462 [Suillus occidentalis]|nr:hypothetical protein EDD22DRAFT_883462 [Suillus occidentalis]